MSSTPLASELQTRMTYRRLLAQKSRWELCMLAAALALLASTLAASFGEAPWLSACSGAAALVAFEIARRARRRDHRALELLTPLTRQDVTSATTKRLRELQDISSEQGRSRLGIALRRIHLLPDGVPKQQAR